jgi:beta-phosphoglucomutase-like phosphatase (HAD superfamily)
MDGTMIDSMPYHAQSWVTFASATASPSTSTNCCAAPPAAPAPNAWKCCSAARWTQQESWELIHQKEQIYRELFAPVFAEVRRLQGLQRRRHGRGLRVGVGTAGDKHNIAFAMLAPGHGPDAACRGGRRRGPGRQARAGDLSGGGAAHRRRPASLHRVRGCPFGIEAARRAGMRAVAVCTSHSAEQLAGPHVVASVRNYHELIESNFLGNLHANHA